MVVAATAALSTNVPAAVFGSDGRQLLPDADKSFNDKIGVLSNARLHSVCTAFCVSEDVVATAAHCLYRTKGERPPRLSDFTFRLFNGPERNVTLIAGGRTGNAEQSIASGTRALSIKPPIEATSDWALVRLARPSCKAGGLHLSARAPAELERLGKRHRVYNVAFHRDFGDWRLAEDRTCDIHEDAIEADDGKIARDFTQPGRLILHTCDTGAASSGSPLLVDGPSGPEVVGINVGTYVQSKVLLQKGEVIHRYRSENVANTAVSTLAFLDTFAAFERAEVLSDKKKIADIQRLLAARGLFAGARDGVFGNESREAIETYQRAEGLAVLGLPTLEVLSRLTGSAPVAADKRPAQGPDGVETGTISGFRPAQATPPSR